jgi:predicted transglutaminase-like cysteine proteinase
MHALRFFCLLACLCSALGARAATPGAELPVATAAAEQGSATAPLGWADFCRKNPVDCAVGEAPATHVVINAQSWRWIVTINDQVNRAIAPVTDQEHWGVAESWDYPSDGEGDCEDYVLLKRKRLIEAGLPRQALLITVVSDLKGEGHAVLTVKTDRGEFILDNQNPRVVAWTSSGYRFVKRQSQENPNRWVWLGWASGETATAAR